MWSSRKYFLIENDLLYKTQFNFKKDHSTSPAILKLVHEITNNFDQNEFTLSAFIDLSKILSTVGHLMLLPKFRCLAIKEAYFRWFKSYLNNRKQYKTEKLDITYQSWCHTKFNPGTFDVYKLY